MSFLPVQLRSHIPFSNIDEQSGVSRPHRNLHSRFPSSFLKRRTIRFLPKAEKRGLRTVDTNFPPTARCLFVLRKNALKSSKSQAYGSTMTDVAASNMPSAVNVCGVAT